MVETQETPTGLGHADRAGFLLIGQGIGVAVGVLSPLVLTRLVTPGEYGTYRQLLLLAALFSPIVTLGLPNATLYLFPRLAPPDRRRLIWQATVVLLATTTITAGAIIAVRRPLGHAFHNPALPVMIPLFCIYLVGVLANTHVYQLLVVRERVRQAALYTAAVTGLPTLGAVIFGFARRDLGAMVTGLVVGGAVVAALGYVSVGSFLWQQRAAGRPVRPPRQLLREQLRYGVPLGLSLAVASLSLYVDQVIVSALLFPAAYAVYSVAWTPVRLFATVTSAVATTLVPVWSRALQEERLEEALRLSREAARRLSLLLIPGCCILSLAAPDLIRLLFSARYEASIPVFRVAVFVLPAQVFMADAFLSAMGRTGVLLGGSLGALVIESGFVALGIRLAGLPGAAVAAVTVNVLLRGCYGWAIRRRAGTEASALLPWSNLLRTTAVCATAAVPAGAAMLLFHPGVVRLGTGFAVYAIAYISLLVATRTATRADLELVRRWASVRFVVGGRRAPRTAL